MRVFQWHGCRFFANLPEPEFSSFRETGYAKKVLHALNGDIELFKTYDVFVMFRLAAHKQEWVIPSFSKPLILFVISHERGDVPESVINKAFIIFKHYLKAELDGNCDKLFRIPVGPSNCFPLQVQRPFCTRDINVFFSGNLHLGRAALYKELTGFSWLPFPLLHRMRRFLGTEFGYYLPSSYISFSDGFHKGLSSQSYAFQLANAKIVLCPYGLDDHETMRHFEAMQQGCVIVTDKMPDTFYFHGAPFVVVPGWKNLKPVIQGLLNDPEELEALHRKTIKWWQDICSVEAVTNYIRIKILGNDIPIEHGPYDDFTNANTSYN